MKILLVNTFYYPNMIGGTENSVKLLAEYLVKDGNEVAVYCADNKINKINIENINNVKIYRGFCGKYDTSLICASNKKFKKIKNKILEINNKTVIDEISYVLEDFVPDIIHTNNLFGISNIIWKIAKEKYNIPVVHTLRDYWMLNPITFFKKCSIIQNFMRKKTQYVDVVTAPSKYTLNKFIDNKYFKFSKQVCVPNAIDININETKKIIDDKYKRSGKISFMFVGMLTNNKGIKNLVKVFRRIEDNNIILNIYGQGELKDYVELNVKEDSRIKYHGQLEKEKLKEEWIKNDVLVVPSIWEEPFGRVVIEGNQYGLPVIGANIAGIKEILDNINTGITYQYNNIDELYELIKEFSNRDTIKKYFSNIYNNIEKYSIYNQIKEFSKLYEELL